MQKKNVVFGLTLLSLLAMALAAGATSNIKNQWLDAYPDACAELVTAAQSCTLCHSDAPDLNSYGADRAQFGSFANIEGRDSDGDTVNNLDEIQACTLPGDRTSVTPTDSATWSGIKTLYN